MDELTQSQAQKRTWSSVKYFEAFVTIVVGGMDINIGFLVKLRKVIEEECIVECGGALTHKHFQMVVKGDV